MKQRPSSAPRTPTMTRAGFLKTAAASALGFGAAGYVDGQADRPAKQAGAFRKLGRTGFMVSPVALGTGRIDDPAVIRYALDHGVNLLDTGRRYQNGRNEEMLAKLLGGSHPGVTVITKLAHGSTDDRASMERSLTESLRALKTDCIDALLIHDTSSTDEILSGKVKDFFAAAKKAGKIRFCGFSAHTNHVEMLRTAVKDRFYDVVLVPYTHAGRFHHTVYGFDAEWNQKALEKAMADAVAAGIGVLAMKVCSAGPAPDETTGRKSYAAALKWVLRNPNVSSMTVAMANFEQAAEDTGVMAN